MSKEILHIWGPFSIQSYGLFVALGIITASWLFLKDKRRKSIVSYDQFNKIITFIILVAIAGGRILFAIEEGSSINSFFDLFKIWEGGLSSLGAIISILIFTPIYLKHLKIPIIKFLDLAGIYAPVIESIARIGCFMAGCCYGAETNLPWAVTHCPNSCLGDACCKYVHPTQIYSSIAAAIIFSIMYFFVQKFLIKRGQLISAYLALTSIARFSIDFLRGDRTYFDQNIGIFATLSTAQIISMLICFASLITILLIQFWPKNKKIIK